MSGGMAHSYNPGNWYFNTRYGGTCTGSVSSNLLTFSSLEHEGTLNEVE